MTISKMYPRENTRGQNSKPKFRSKHGIFENSEFWYRREMGSETVGYMKKSELCPKSDEEPLKQFKQKHDMKGHF